MDQLCDELQVEARTQGNEPGHGHMVAPRVTLAPCGSCHVRREEDSPQDDLEFRYNPAGNRAVKVVKPRIDGDPSPETDWTYSYYIHDAQGNPMAMYTRRTLTSPNTQDEFALSELPLYGGARLGTAATDRAYTVRFNGTSGTSTAVSSTQLDGESTLGRAYVYTMPGTGDGHDTYPIQLQALLGKKTYELSNHLGNVLATVSDRRVAVPDAVNADEVDHYAADVRSVADYYPFGSLLPGRNYSSDSYKWGFNGQLKDDEIHGATGTSYAFEFRMHDPRVGRFLSIDPLAAKYPYWSPYAFAGNTPIQAKDLEGAETFYTQYLENTGDNLIRVQARQDINRTPVLAAAMIMTAGGLGAAAYAPEIMAWTSSFTLLHGEAINEGSALVWGIFLDEEYPLPAGSDNLARAARYGISNLTEALTKSNRVHIDIGGHGRYDDALNFTDDAEDYAGKAIPNLVEGRAQDNLKAVKDASVDLFHIENAPFTPDIMKEVGRTLKSGGQVLLDTPMMPTGGWGEYAKQFGLSVSFQGRTTRTAADGTTFTTHQVTMTKP